MSHIKKISNKKNPADQRSWGGYFSRPDPTGRPNFWHDKPYSRTYQNLPQYHHRINKSRKAVFDQIYFPVWQRY